LSDGVDPGGVSSAPTTDAPPGSLRWRWAALGLLTAVGGFQVALAAGLPWGRASWGGAHAGVLPTNLRVASGASALVYAGLAAVLTGLLWNESRRAA